MTAVALISREFPPFFGGGIGTYTERFSAALAQRGHKVVVVTVSADGRESREDRAGVTVVRLPFIRGDDWSGPDPAIATPETRAAFRQFSPVSVFAMQAARALPALVEEFDIRVVEAPETGALSWFALNDRRIGRPCGRRPWPAFVTHLHSPTAWIELWDRAPQAGRAHAELKRMERDVIFWADGLVCPSRALADWAEAHFGLAPGSVEVIRHPLAGLEDSPEREGPRGDGPRRVVYAGRLEPRKGVDLLLAAFVRAVERGADLRLDLAGRDIRDVRTGRDFGAFCLDRLVPPELRPRIAVHGNVRPGAVTALRRAGDLGAAPAPCDNFPYACVEAMAEGLPVVAARAGGVAEMISGDGDGLLFEPGDVDGCARALERAARMSRDDLAEMGRAARARIAMLCATDGVVRARLRHFERLAPRVPARRVAPVVFFPAGRGDAPPDPCDDRLAEAVRAGADFAHAWARAERGVIALGTPTLAGLAAAPRAIGRLAVATPALHALCDADRRSPWHVAVALARSGLQGAVVPDTVVDAGGEAGASWPRVEGDAAVALCNELGPAMVASIESDARRLAPRPGASEPAPGPTSAASTRPDARPRRLIQRLAALWRAPRQAP